MEEQNKNPEEKENEVQTSQENTPQNATPTRSYVLMILAGCYLLYTGYSGRNRFPDRGSGNAFYWW